MARTKKLERLAPAEGSEFTTLTREQLLLHADEVGAAAELRRRAFNKMVKRESKIQ